MSNQRPYPDPENSTDDSEQTMANIVSAIIAIVLFLLVIGFFASWWV